MDNVTREAKVSVILDITKALRSIDTIQNRLDKLSIKRFKQEQGNPFKDLNKNAEEAEDKIKSLEAVYRQAKKEMSEALYANRMDIGFTASKEYKDLAKNLEEATDNLNTFKKIQKSLNPDIRNKQFSDMQNKTYLAEQKRYLEEIRAAKKAALEEERRLKKQQAEENKRALQSEMEATKALADMKKEASKEQKTNTFKSYSAELAKIERQAAIVYRELQNPLSDTNISKLQLELKRLTDQYEKVNREAVNFRKQVGVNNSRGFYDINHSLDYFRAKVRSRLVYSFATEAEGLLTSIPEQILSSLSSYQQNRVNFAQVMPDEVANNQQVMNDAMREFTQIAADYGTAVSDVTEAGRLWGRQYKDLNIVQELVRNSTKLSITDNMSLVEVNKALEATMQQYNVQLKNAAEAQQVSGKIVDSWAKLADNAVVTAGDMAKANERAAGAAYQAGVGFDYLQAMIATMSTATGKAGGEIGRSIRSMLVSMTSGKAQKFFNELGIATRELGSDGVMRVRSYEKVITELMQKLKTTPKDVSNVILAMSGGKQNCPPLWEHKGNKRFYIG